MIFARARTRLTLTNVLVMVLLLLALGGGIVVALDRFLVAQETSSLNNEAQQSVSEFGELSESGFRERHTSYAAGTFYVVWDTSGTPIFNPANVDTQALRPPAMAALAGHATTETVRLSGSQDTLVASQLLVEDRNTIGAMQVGQSLAPLHQVEDEVVLLVALVGAAVLLLSVGAGWFLAGRALVPIKDALDRQKSFTADASHELRTPLTVIDTGLQMLGRHRERKISEYSEILDSMQQESQRMNRLVGSLLVLARADSGDAELQRSEIDAAAVVRTAVKDLEPLAQSKDVAIETKKLESVTAALDPDRFKQLVVILIDNAITHGAHGGKVDVGLVRHDRNLVLEVADRGPGIPADQRERVFERFHRLNPGRNGSGAGLGLSIARWIVSRHGGAISLHDNHPGLRLSVTLPIQSGSNLDSVRSKPE